MAGTADALRCADATLARVRQASRQLRVPGIGASALYAATVLTELPVIWIRLLLVFAGATLALLLEGDAVRSAQVLAQLALLPTGWSLLALVTPAGGGWWWRQKMGGREPSGRERAAYEDAIQTIHALSPEPFRLPSTWFVIDTQQPDGAVCGDWLMISRGLLESEWLAAVLAHELGHINSSDGKLTAALNRLIINPPPRSDQDDEEPSRIVIGGGRLQLGISVVGGLAWLVRSTIRFAGGGFALRLLAPFWGCHWREREYAADRFAACLGPRRTSSQTSSSSTP